MRARVEHLFPAYSERHEGLCLSLYLDIFGWATTSIGVLVDPIERALPLAWMIDGRRATEAEIRRDWQAVKALKERGEDLRKWTAKRQEPLTQIRLTLAASDELVRQRLRANVAYVRRHIPGWDRLPADAQLALASLMWAIGAGLERTRPKLVAAVNAGDWARAKAEAHIREDNNPGVRVRNDDQERCFDNAAVVDQHGLDPEVLHWPASVIPPVTITGEEEHRS